MFRELLAHPQEALHKLHLVYCVRVMSVDCYQGWSGFDRIFWFIYFVLECLIPSYWFIRTIINFLHI
jgi:hypothetical protein